MLAVDNHLTLSFEVERSKRRWNRVRTGDGNVTGRQRRIRGVPRMVGGREHHHKVSLPSNYGEDTSQDATLKALWMVVAHCSTLRVQDLPLFAVKAVKGLLVVIFVI